MYTFKLEIYGSIYHVNYEMSIIFFRKYKKSNQIHLKFQFDALKSIDFISKKICDYEITDLEVTFNNTLFGLAIDRIIMLKVR